jgi:hypothetical protein
LKNSRCLLKLTEGEILSEERNVYKLDHKEINYRAS